MVHAVHQVLRIGDVRHLFIAFQFLGYPFQRVGVGIVGLHLKFDGSHKGIGPQKFAGVCAHGLCLFFQCLFFADVGEVVDVGSFLQVVAQHLGLRPRHVFGQHQGHSKVLLDIRREIPRRKHGENDHSQQNQHQCGAYT